MQSKQRGFLFLVWEARQKFWEFHWGIIFKVSDLTLFEINICVFLPHSIGFQMVALEKMQRPGPKKSASLRWIEAAQSKINYCWKIRSDTDGRNSLSRKSGSIQTCLIIYHNHQVVTWSESVHFDHPRPAQTEHLPTGVDHYLYRYLSVFVLVSIGSVSEGYSANYI